MIVVHRSGIVSPKLSCFHISPRCLCRFLYSLKDKDGDDDSTLDTLESLGAVMLEISERE